MDAFGLQRHIVADYSDYTRKFFGIVDDRLRLCAEFDVIVARDLYGRCLDEMSFILEGFPTAKKYEVEKYGELRSWRPINELFHTLPGEPHPGQSPSAPPAIDLLVAAVDEPDEFSGVVEDAFLVPNEAPTDF